MVKQKIVSIAKGRVIEKYSCPSDAVAGIV